MDGFPDGLRGRYAPLRPLGRGGMGRVWAARDLRDGATVAVKVLADSLADDPVQRERLRREATLALGVEHPNLIRTVGAHLDEAPCSLVVEFVEGRSLREVLAADRPLPPSRVLAVLEGLAGALGALHGAGLLHRDVKPDNVMIRPDSSPVLIDLGLMRRREGTALTATGTIMGTPVYLAPEVCRGETAGPAADVFALGVLGVELCWPSDPFPGDGAGRLRLLAERAAGRSACPLPPGLPGPLADLLDSLTTGDPARRPEHGAAALAQMARVRELFDSALPAGATLVRGQAPLRTATRVVPRPASRPPSRAAPPRRRAPAVAGLVLFVLVLALVAARSSEGPSDPGPPAAAAAPVAAPVSQGEPSPEAVALFRAALSKLVGEPVREGLGPLRRAARALGDPDSVRMAVAWTLDQYFLGFEEKDPSVEAFDAFQRGLALFPLLVELIHDLHGEAPEAAGAAHAELADAGCRFVDGMNKRKNHFRRIGGNPFLGPLSGTSLEVVRQMAGVEPVFRAMVGRLEGLDERGRRDGVPLPPYLRLIVLRGLDKAGRGPEAFVPFAVELSASFMAQGASPGAEHLAAIADRVAIDGLKDAGHRLSAAGLLESALARHVKRGLLARFGPEAPSGPGPTFFGSCKELLLALGREPKEQTRAVELWRGILPALPYDVQREQLLSFVDYHAGDGAFPMALRDELREVARGVASSAPPIPFPVYLADPAFGEGRFSARLAGPYPRGPGQAMILTLDDEEAARRDLSDLEPSNPQILLALPGRVRPGWRRVAVDLVRPGPAGEERIRLWAVVTAVGTSSS